MLPLHRTLTLRYLGQRRTRSVLVVLSIALGVAALVATRTLNQTLGAAARGAVTPFVRTGDLVAVNGQTGVPAALAGQLNAAAIPGLRRAWPLVVGRVGIPELENKAVILVGAPADGLLTAAAGGAGPGVGLPGVTVHLDALPDLLPPRRTPVLVSRALSDRLPGPGPGFRVRLFGKETPVKPLGAVDLNGEATALGSDLLFMDSAAAAAIVYPRRPDYVTRVNLELAPGADVGEVRRRAQEIAGERAEVRTPEADGAAASDVTAGLELGVEIGGAGALVVGLFLVFNALSVSVAERRRDIGILRSTGATRGQVVGLFVGEAALLGTAGAALGVPLGLGMARAALGLMRDTLSDVFGLPPQAGGIRVTSATLALAAAAGVVTALAAALVPAAEAALEDPAHAVRRVPRRARALFLGLYLAAVAALAAAGVGFVAGRGRLPPRAGAFGGIVCVLLAALAATPLAARLVGGGLRPVFRRLFGVEGRLAADNLVRSPGRTGVVIAALAATGALMVMTSGFIRSTEQTLLGWIDDRVGADLFVTAGGAFNNGSQQLPMSEGVRRRLLQIPGVATAVAVRGHALDFRNRIVVLLALDATAFGGADGGHAIARNLARFPRLREPNTALVSENFAALYGVNVGDRVTVRGLRGPLDLEVIGTAVDYSWNRGTLIVDRGWFRTAFADDEVDLFDVYLKPEHDPETVREEIVRGGKADALVVQTRPELRADVSTTLRRIYGLAYAQQAVVGMVALLGVVSALFISVLQRRRELGLLRAVGASRAQVLRSVLAEASLMGAVGAGLGFLVGLLLEWYVVKILLFDDAGWVFPLHVPWTATAWVLGSSVALATLVGLWPAVQATQIRIPEAIAYE